MTLVENYQFGVGRQRVSGRKVLNQLLNPATQQFLLQSGLKPGMRVLDLNCGMGLMSCWIAEQVGPEGHVIACDNSEEHLTIAREVASDAGLNNIEFTRLTVDQLDQLSDKFDFIYCRFLLIHAKNPKDVLTAIYDHLEQGGVFACESAILGHEFCYPHSEAFEKWRTLNHDVFEAMNKDPQTGKKLYSMMFELGFHTLNGKLFQPVLSDATARQEMLLNDLKEQEQAFIASGLASEEEIEEIYEGLQELVEDDSHFIAYCQSCQVSGVK